MKKNAQIFLLFIFFSNQIFSQDSVQAVSTFEEDAALVAMTGVLFPLAIAGTIVSFVPPSIGLMNEKGVNYTTLSFESGFGFGTTKGAGIFSDSRVQISYTHVARTSIRNFASATITKDFHGNFIGRKKIALYGWSPNAGMITNFPEKGFTIGASSWIMTTSLPFFGLFPLHTYGISYSYNKFFGGKSFHRISVGISSAVTFEW